VALLLQIDNSNDDRTIITLVRLATHCIRLTITPVNVRLELLLLHSLKCYPETLSMLTLQDSANRPGTLVELVECLTEMGLNVRRARISSDGGWFVDSFEVGMKYSAPSACPSMQEQTEQYGQ
jgi:hypothetical protein